MGGRALYVREEPRRVWGWGEGAAEVIVVSIVGLHPGAAWVQPASEAPSGAWGVSGAEMRSRAVCVMRAGQYGRSNVHE